MKMKMYNQFRGISANIDPSLMLNENVDKAKKFMKDKYILDTAVMSVGKKEIEKVGNAESDPKRLREAGLRVLMGTEKADDIIEDMKNGNKASLAPTDFVGISPDMKKELTDEMRSVKVDDAKLKELLGTDEFKTVRSLSVNVVGPDGKPKAYVLDKDHLGWLSSFVYFHYMEGISIDDLKNIYAMLIENSDILNNLEIMEGEKLVKKPFDLNFINIRIPNNSEKLIDGLNRLPGLRVYKKYEADLPPHLKRDLKEQPQITKDQFAEVAEGFDNLRKDPSTGKPWSDKEKAAKADKDIKGFWGQMLVDTREGSPTFGKEVFQSPISRYKNIRELIDNAKGYLKALGNSGFESFYEIFNKCNLKFGSAGAKQIFLENGIFVIEVNSFGANRVLNGHTTHCIKDSLGQWNNYVNSDRNHRFVEENKQYYIYNFNLLSSDPMWTIGVTIEPEDKYDHVRAAHNKIDRNVAGSIIKILKDWGEEYKVNSEAAAKAKQLGATDEEISKYGGLFCLLRPISGEEYEKKKRARTANIELVKPGVAMDKIKEYVTRDGADINRDEGAALYNAVVEDDVEKAKMILDFGAQINIRDKAKAIINSAKSREMIELLISRGSIATYKVYENICHSPGAVEFCLKAGISPDFENSLPYRRSVKGTFKDKNDMGETYMETLKLVIKYGASLTGTNGEFMALKWAAEYARLDVMEYLIEEIGVKHTFVATYSWISYAFRISDSAKLSVYRFLLPYILEFEPNLWDALPDTKKWHLKLEK